MASTSHRTATSPFRPARIGALVVPVLSLLAALAGAHPTAVAAGETAPTSSAVSASSAAAVSSLTPDRTAEYVGGAAALLRTSKGADVPGTLFVLMAYRGSQAKARVYDETPYVLSERETHPMSIESNGEARRLVEELTGNELAMVDFTSPPGGGLSTGLTYAIAYLDIVSDGAFTGGLRVASTGDLQPGGYVHPVGAINEKTAAAHLAGVDVLFTPSVPSADSLAAYAGRFEGEISRSRNTGATLEAERRWDRYETWGAGDEAGALDVVGVRHVGDVAAYLCGTGSDEACRIRSLLSDVVVDNSSRKAERIAVDGVGADVR